ncbi:MAG: B-box zinc finger protein [Candidatus Lernaella stagnicola]|nr:B-box zinc finger protein [Candidatus Lernaella stagnicola]
MKCYFHPEEDAIYECTSCRKAICGDCMRFDDEDNVVCPACTLEYAVDIADEDQAAYLEKRHRAIEQRERRKRAKQSRIAMINPFFVVAIILLVALHIFFRHYVGRAGQPAVFDPAAFAKQGDPALELSYIAAKLFAYAEDHDGEFPEKIKALYPNYLEAPPNVLGSSESYNFTPVNGEELFVLSLLKADRFRYRRLYITGDGVLKTE